MVAIAVKGTSLPPGQPSHKFCPNLSISAVTLVRYLITLASSSKASLSGRASARISGSVDCIKQPHVAIPLHKWGLLKRIKLVKGKRYLNQKFLLKKKKALSTEGKEETT